MIFDISLCFRFSKLSYVRYGIHVEKLTQVHYFHFQIMSILVSISGMLVTTTHRDCVLTCVLQIL